MKKRMITFFISRPDMFTFLIGALIFIIAATIVNAPMDARKGGIYGVFAGMVGGLWYDKIKNRLEKRTPRPELDELRINACEEAHNSISKTTGEGLM